MNEITTDIDRQIKEKKKRIEIKANGLFLRQNIPKAKAEDIGGQKKIILTLTDVLYEYCDSPKETLEAICETFEFAYGFRPKKLEEMIND